MRSSPTSASRDSSTTRASLAPACSIGTPGYLSPEQVSGERRRQRDRRLRVRPGAARGAHRRSPPSPGRAGEAASARLVRDPEIPASFGPGWVDLLRRDDRARSSRATDGARGRRRCRGARPRVIRSLRRSSAAVHAPTWCAAFRRRRDRRRRNGLRGRPRRWNGPDTAAHDVRLCWRVARGRRSAVPDRADPVMTTSDATPRRAEAASASRRERRCVATLVIVAAVAIARRAVPPGAHRRAEPRARDARTPARRFPRNSANWASTCNNSMRR